MTTGAMRAAAGRNRWLIGGALAVAAALAVDAWQTASPNVEGELIEQPAAAPAVSVRPAPRAKAQIETATQSCTGFGPSAAATVISPGTWVTSDDYPADAIRRESQGTSAIRFRASADGRVMGCTVTASSGDPLLDTTACRLVTERGRYTPERDMAGCPIASAAKTLRLTWRIPPE